MGWRNWGVWPEVGGWLSYNTVTWTQANQNFI